ncbi:MAG: hypothetical protein R2817_06730 [Flavobacteriales bacterium]
MTVLTFFVLPVPFARSGLPLFRALSVFFALVPRVFVGPVEGDGLFLAVAAFLTAAADLRVVLEVVEDAVLADLLGLTAFFVTVRFAGGRLLFGGGVRFLAMVS